MLTNNMLSAQRVVGRLFSQNGKLHLVLEVDPASRMARVSCRVDDATQVIAMPIAEVMQHLDSSSALKLDGLNSERTEERILEKDDGWFFRAREGEYGPFSNSQAAKRALSRHVLLAQEEGRTGRPVRSTPGS